MTTTIYTKNGCPYCQMAVDSFQRQGITYSEVNLSEYPERVVEIIQLTGLRKVPVIVENGRATAGYNGGG